MSAVAEELIVSRAARVMIRYRTLDDALDDFHWRRDPEIARFDAREPYRGTYSEFLQAYAAELRLPDPTRRAFAIDTHDGVHIGSIMYYNASGGDVAELGITLGRSGYRDGGLGTEAVVAFLALAWGATPLRRIMLHTLEWNARARSCFVKAGFTEQAIIVRGENRFVRMEVAREWWLLWEQQGRFRTYLTAPSAT